MLKEVIVLVNYSRLLVILFMDVAFPLVFSNCTASKDDGRFLKVSKS